MMICKNERIGQRRLVAAAALSLCSLTALAQTTTAAKADPAKDRTEPTQPDRVVVTATKREAVLTDVSLGISALSGKALDERGVATLEDLGANALGMNIVSARPGENLLVSRGISTSQSFSLQSGPAVGIYVDELPLVGLTSGVPDFGLWDVARVEMLRGPQGTLYGEGAMAGTIRIISNAPDAHRFSSRVQLTGAQVQGGGSGGGARAMVNVPLAHDVAALRATVGYNKDPGWISAPDLQRDNINGGHQTEARLALRVVPSAALKLDASLWYQDSSKDASGNQTSPGVFSPPALGIGAFPSARLNSDQRDSTMANLTINYDAGAFSVVSATSYAKQKIDAQFDTTETAPFYFGAAATGATLLNARAGHLEMTSQELRLVSNGDGRLNWTVGGYLKSLDRHVDNTWNIVVPLAELVDNSLVISDTTSKSKALFGELDWKLAKAWTLTGGLRYYSDDRTATANVTNYSPIFQVPVGVSGPVATRESQVTYNLVLSHMPTDKVNLFARAASGFRSGGPNFWVQDPENIPKDYKAEKLDSVEFGIKTQARPWLVFNAYAYQIRWRDKQVNLSTPSGEFDYISNASSAKSTGAEFELQAYPAAGLSLSAAATYTDAKLSADLLSSTQTLIAPAGNRLPYVSPWELKGALDYRWPLRGTLSGLANLSLAYRGANYSDISNAASTDNGSYRQVNLRAGVESRGAWSAVLFVRNLTNSHSITTIQQSVAGVVRYPNYIQPRTVGVDLQAWF